LSLKSLKIYKWKTDRYGLYFNSAYGPYFGAGPSIGISSDSKFYSRCNCDPFRVPKNAKTCLNEITEELEHSPIELKDYEVFAILPK
jgi:hypothetical protein